MNKVNLLSARHNLLLEHLEGELRVSVNEFLGCHFLFIKKLSEFSEFPGQPVFT